MINILIVEDNKLQLNALKCIIEQCDTGQSVCPYTASDYNEAVDIISSIHIDIFFLDVMLSDEDTAPCGIDLGRYIRTIRQYRFTPVIYITSIPGQINDAVNDIHCYNYLVKPYRREDVEKLLHSVVNSPMLSSEPVRITDVNSVSHNISPESIAIIASFGHKIVIYCSDCTVTTRQAGLDSIMAELPGYFMRIHRKYIINMRRIDNYDKTSCLIRINNESVPIGRTYKSIFEERYNLT